MVTNLDLNKFLYGPRGYNESEHCVGLILASQLDKLPNEPGVYVWFPPLNPNLTESLHSIIKDYSTQCEYNSHLYTTVLENERGTTHASVHRRIAPYDLNKTDDSIIGTLESAGISEVGLNLFKLFAFSNIFSGALYVGVARGKGAEGQSGLRLRIPQHIRTGTIKDRLMPKIAPTGAKAVPPILLENCLILYMTFGFLKMNDGTQISQELKEKVAELLEPVLIQALNPEVNRKQGR